MNNHSLLVSGIFIATLSSSFFVEAADTCGLTHTLPNDQWQQVSLPCEPGGGGTIAEVFSDDISDAFGGGEEDSRYGENWILFKYDGINNQYITLSEDSKLEAGVGYWIIQRSGGEATLDLPADSSVAAAVKGAGCPSTEGCYEIALSTQSNAIGWNMIGSPLGYTPALSAARIRMDSGVCADGCELKNAQSNDFVHGSVWSYSSAAGYDKESYAEGQWKPWAGYWLATLKNADGLNPTLLVPVEEPAKCSVAMNAAPLTKDQLKEMIKNKADVSQVNTSQITDMSYLFARASDFNQDISCWDVSSVTDMGGLFFGTTQFNQDIGGWNVGSVTNMGDMFYKAAKFNQDIGNWEVSSVTNMRGMFFGAAQFNQDIGNWEVSSVTDMGSLFFGTTQFNQDIGGWNVGSVTNMGDMFHNAAEFNQDIGNWEVSSVTNMRGMFFGAAQFNQDIGNWEVSSVTNMRSMFINAKNFNQNINDWDVSKVASMSQMFNGARAFNQDISDWDVSQVINMSFMFRGARAFTQQDLSGWNVSKVTKHNNFFDGAGSGNIEPNWQ
jgi:surface protein